MRKFGFWTCMIWFIILQSIDMFLTGWYIGNNWEKECCPPMSWMIREIGIGQAIFYARAAAYLFFFIILATHKYKTVQYFMISFMLFYTLAMVDWLFVLGILQVPF